jgi:hypothetical protein
MALRGGVMRRGTSNGNERGSAEGRRRRREWLVATYRADVDVHLGACLWPGQCTVSHLAAVPLGQGTPACRCYRCGALLTVETVTADRIKPGCQGGTYKRSNIRPACGLCNSITGGAVRGPLTSQKGKTVPRIRRGGNHRKNARFTNGRPATLADRKVSGCLECGAQPGGSCYTLVSVRQVNEGREGAYLKTMAKLHASRGRAL